MFSRRCSISGGLWCRLAIRICPLANAESRSGCLCFLFLLLHAFSSLLLASFTFSSLPLARSHLLPLGLFCLGPLLPVFFLFLFGLFCLTFLVVLSLLALLFSLSCLLACFLPVSRGVTKRAWLRSGTFRVISFRSLRTSSPVSIKRIFLAGRRRTARRVLAPKAASKASVCTGVTCSCIRGRTCAEPGTGTRSRTTATRTASRAALLAHRPARKANRQHEDEHTYAAAGLTYGPSPCFDRGCDGCPDEPHQRGANATCYEAVCLHSQ